MPTQRIEFGYYPQPLTLASGHITIAPLPKLAESVIAVEGCREVEGDWIYAPVQEVQHLGGGVRQRPYSARVFGLPKTHVLEHTSADGNEHLDFHVWALSFFTGMRLSSTEAGFLDATPIKPGELVDFVLVGGSLADAIALAEKFWVDHRPVPQRSRLIAAAVHALFLSQNPRHLQFERFLLLYTAFDACFALAKSLFPPENRVLHADRVPWMCSQFGMPIPAWADPLAPTGAEVASMRNETVHEALFMGEPLGFALHGVGTNQNLPLEMEALVCRLLAALLGGKGGKRTDYVVSPVNTRQRHGLDLTP
jgi:hypothetical protein